mmetsp:Transcript_20850/g.48982  ORF Transcript_20850/g.48982 Transcript_20850/m.48982 type:complete len:240 (-) Transcript_20850:563-1282(-)
MWAMLFIRPSSATCTRSSARLLTSSAGRISTATPIPGRGLISAPTQSARSVGSCTGGMSPSCDRSASIWPGVRSFCRASSTHRSTRDCPSGSPMFGSVNVLAFDIARATDILSPSGASTDTPLDSASSSSELSINLTEASVHPSSDLSTSPSMTNRRVALSDTSHGASSSSSSPEANEIPTVPGITSSAGPISKISTSTPALSGSVWPVDSLAIPSMPSVGTSSLARCRIRDLSVGCWI